MERYFQVFENKNHANWYLIKLPIQIAKLSINAWASHTNLSVTGCRFHQVIFRLDVFRKLQKQEFSFPVSLCKQRKLSKKYLSVVNLKNNKRVCPIRASLVSVKIIFLKLEEFLCFFKKLSCFQLLSIKLFLFQNKMLLECRSFGPKRNSFLCLLLLRQINILRKFYLKCTSSLSLQKIWPTKSLGYLVNLQKL